MRLYVFDDYRLGVLTTSSRLADITELVDARVAPRDRMTALINDWPLCAERVAAAAQGVGISLSSAALLPPQPRPGKIVAAPVNYRLHQAEMGGAGGVYAGTAIKTI